MNQTNSTNSNQTIRVDSFDSWLIFPGNLLRPTLESCYNLLMHITIPTNAEDWLRQRAEQSGFANVQDYVLSIVLPQQVASRSNGSRSFYESASEFGLIGGGSEYAADLSTNPEHMAGFGE